MKLGTVELKAFVPARDMDLSLRFHRDLGFAMPWVPDDLACLRIRDFVLDDPAGVTWRIGQNIGGPNGEPE